MAKAHIKAQMSLDNSKFTKGLNQSKKGVSSMGASLGPLKGLIAGAFAVGAVVSFTKQALAAADALDNMAIATGIGVESLQAMGVVAKESGLGMAGMQDVLSDMGKNIAEAANGNQGMIDTLNSIGVSVDDLIGLAPDKQFEIIAKAIKNNGDNAETTSAKYKLFGGQAKQLNSLLIELGNNGLDGTIAKYKELGLVIDETSIKTLDMAEQTLGRAGTKLKNFGSVALASLINGFADLNDSVHNALGTDNFEEAQARAKRARDRYGIETNDERKARWEAEDQKAIDDKQAIADEKADKERKARLKDIAEMQDKMLKASSSLFTQIEERRFNALDIESQYNLTSYRLEKEKANLKNKTGLDEVNTRQKIFDIEGELLKLEKEKAKIKEDQIKKAEEQRKKELEAAKRLKEEKLKDLEGVKDRATDRKKEFDDIPNKVGFNAPQATNELQKIGLFVGGRADPLQAKMDRQILIQKKQLEYLKNISESVAKDRDIIAKWG